MLDRGNIVDHTATSTRAQNGILDKWIESHSPKMLRVPSVCRMRDPRGVMISEIT